MGYLIMLCQLRRLCSDIVDVVVVMYGDLERSLPLWPVS
jgi:hypothetical protein